jgi:hypothetical protein
MPTPNNHAENDRSKVQRPFQSQPACPCSTAPESGEAAFHKFSTEPQRGSVENLF